LKFLIFAFYDNYFILQLRYLANKSLIWATHLIGNLIPNPFNFLSHYIRKAVKRLSQRDNLLLHNILILFKPSDLKTKCCYLIRSEFQFVLIVCVLKLVHREFLDVIRELIYFILYFLRRLLCEMGILVGVLCFA